MKTELKIYAALAVLALLAGGFWYTNSNVKAERESRSTSTSKSGLPSITLQQADVDAITKLELTPGTDKPKVVIEKKGDAWEIVEPTAAKASTADVRSLLDNLKELKVTESIDRSAAAYDQHDVADGKGTRIVAYAGADKKLELVFGKSGTRGQLVRVVGTDGVYIVSGYSSFLYSKDAKGWRDKGIVKFEDANVVSVEIDNSHATYSFTKNEDKWTGTRKLKASAKKSDEKSEKKDEKKDEKKKGDAAWAEFEGAKVGDMLRAFKALNAIDFAEAGADTGVDDAAANGGRVRIKLKDDAGDYTLLVGKTQKGANRFVKREGGDGTVYVISSWAADWAVAEPSKFEKKDDKKPGEAEEHGEDDGHGHGDPGLELGLE
jgi:hypothetical protein